jgi:putative iron-only hydrogenase system regulator
MEKKIASIVILIGKGADTQRLNAILTQYGEFILGRQGINIRHRKMSIISIIIEADTDIIGAISGKIGRMANIKVKTAMLKLNENDFSNN